MARITDANLLFAGSEPKFSAIEEITKVDLAKTLNWYSQNKSTKDADKYASDYFKKKLKISNVDQHLKEQEPTFGFICRIVNNGGILSEKDKAWFDSKVTLIKEKTKEKKSAVVVEKQTNTVSIQDRMAEKASECIGELEGQIDEIILSKFKDVPSPYGSMHTYGIKGGHTRFIVEWAKQRRNEFDEVINTDDEELKEGYSNFTKPNLKKIVSFCDQVILDCQKISGESVKSRKPRKRKEKTPEQLVEKLQCCQEFKELNLVSVDPKSIISSTQLWVYNTKTRKLGVYFADDAGGFSVKGTTIQNFSESKSVQKKLRKPQVTIPELMKSGKVALRNFMSDIVAVETALNGRINADTILLKVMK